MKHRPSKRHRAGVSLMETVVAVGVLAIAVPLVVMTMGPLVGLPIREWIGEQTAVYLEFLLATPIVLWAAQPFFVRGWNSIRTLNPNMWTLISLGVAAAYLYSLVATFPTFCFKILSRQC